MMINKIPFFGWILSAIGAFGLAIPFWLCWTIGGIGVKYFYWIPETFQVIPFWDCIGLFIVIAIIKGVLIPKLLSVSNNQSMDKEDKKEE